MSDDSRKAFEDWATHCDYPFEFTTYDDGGYFETDTYVAWIAWKFRDLEVDALKARVASVEKERDVLLNELTKKKFIWYVNDQLGVVDE
jgi:hypothetical protein